MRLRPSRVARAASVVATSLLLAGCVERVLVVESRPPGARVLVDGRDRGTAPVRIPYVHDGLFRVRLEMEGHESVTDEIATCTGADAVPGVDFVAENLWPGRIRRVDVRRYDLPPLPASSYTETEMEAYLRRADAFRQRTEKEVAEPGTPASGRPAPPPPPAPRPPAGR